MPIGLDYTDEQGNHWPESVWVFQRFENFDEANKRAVLVFAGYRNAAAIGEFQGTTKSQQIDNNRIECLNEVCTEFNTYADFDTYFSPAAQAGSTIRECAERCAIGVWPMFAGGEIV
jgi:hypothetical protein